VVNFNIEIRKVVLSFVSYGKQEIALINEYLENHFVVIVAIRKGADKEYLLDDHQISPSSNLYIFECDFENKYSSQEFQQLLFKSFYPIDVLVTDLGDTSEIILNPVFPFEGSGEFVKMKLNPFANLLTCMFPMLNTKRSFFFEIFKSSYLNGVELKELKRMAESRKKIILDKLLEDNSNTNIIHQKIDLLLDGRRFLKSGSLGPSYTSYI